MRSWLGVHGAWLIRGVLVLALVGIGLAALSSLPLADQQPSPPPTSGLAPVAAAAPTLANLVPSPRPTATTEPYVEHIVSRLSRETPPPYPTSTPLPADLAVVEVVDFGFLPTMTRIHVGQTVAWSNGGRELHDVTGDDDWHSGAMEPTVEYRHTFGFAGTFNYRCTVHLDMRGTVVVTP